MIVNISGGISNEGSEDSVNTCSEDSGSTTGTASVDSSSTCSQGSGSTTGTASVGSVGTCSQDSGSAPTQPSVSLRQLREPGDGIAGIAADSLRINGAIRQFKQVLTTSLYCNSVLRHVRRFY
jgi:hypothetical protein